MIFYKLKRSWSCVRMAGCSWFRAWSLTQPLYFLPGHASCMGETPGKNLPATSLLSFVSLPKTLLCDNFSVTLQSNKVAVVALSYYANHNYGPVDFSIRCLSNLAPCQGSTAILYSQESDILSSPPWLGCCYLSGVSAFASGGDHQKERAPLNAGAPSSCSSRCVTTWLAEACESYKLCGCVSGPWHTSVTSRVWRMFCEEDWVGLQKGYENGHPTLQCCQGNSVWLQPQIILRLICSVTSHARNTHNASFCAIFISWLHSLKVREPELHVAAWDLGRGSFNTWLCVLTAWAEKL